MDRDLSEFNGSQLKILRIDEIIKGIIVCRHTLNLRDWLNYLMDFDMELESVKKPNEKEELDRELKQLAENINKHQMSRSRIKNKTLGTPAEIIDQLNKYQRRLLKIYKESGLELKLQEGALGGFGK